MDHAVVYRFFLNIITVKIVKLNSDIRSFYIHRLSNFASFDCERSLQNISEICWTEDRYFETKL
jgi:hypothetical protein